MNFDSPEQLSTAEIKWQAAMAQVESLVDKLGKGIDEGIKQPLAAFIAHEIPTSQSCEGHEKKEDGLPYPWIEIQSEPPEGWQDDEQKQKQWTIENNRLRQRLELLLAEFYEQRESSDAVRLTFEDHGAFAAFRILSQAKESPENRLADMQKEINDFGQFLKEKI